MSDSENDYYTNSSDSEAEEEPTVPPVPKKNSIINAANKFGTYIEDEDNVGDSDPDDADADDDVEEEADEDVADDDVMDDDVADEQAGGADDAEPDEDPDDEDDIEVDEDGVVVEKPSKATVVKPSRTTQMVIVDDPDDDDDEYDEHYLQKFDYAINQNYIADFHPECLNHNSDEVSKLARVIRDESNTVVDPLHKTLPYLTKYERARVLGQRAKQIETGAKPFVKVPENIIDSYVIAELELREKKIPFIIKRPIPGGAFEYWHLKDLENILF